MRCMSTTSTWVSAATCISAPRVPRAAPAASFETGDIASVVINYPTLEAAAKKIGPVIAVGMEYEAVDANHSAPGRVTFYAFAPDEGTGEFRRVKSANFDGRGEKYLPGACTTCHGGRPRAPQPNRLLTYASEADTQIGATFMPWDLESFLFSDTDSNFPRDASNAALRDSLTRSRQEAQFKRLNLAAYSTYGSGSGPDVRLPRLVCRALPAHRDVVRRRRHAERDIPRPAGRAWLATGRRESGLRRTTSTWTCSRATAALPHAARDPR